LKSSVGYGVDRNVRIRRVGITGTNYKPLDNEFQIREALEDMCLLINRCENIFEKALLLLVLLSYIQPFVDGNKRTARIVSNAELLANGYCPLIDYLAYLQDTWLVFSIENLQAKLAEKESNKKYYFIDNGLLTLFLIDPLTSLLENQVAVQLRRLYGDDVYFYNRNVEVDFYVLEQQLAVQVSYSLKDVEIRKREIDALIAFSKQMQVKRMLIITKDEEEIISMMDYTIEVLPIWKWLMG